MNKTPYPENSLKMSTRIGEFLIVSRAVYTTVSRTRGRHNTRPIAVSSLRLALSFPSTTCPAFFLRPSSTPVDDGLRAPLAVYRIARPLLSMTTARPPTRKSPRFPRARAAKDQSSNNSWFIGPAGHVTTARPTHCTLQGGFAPIGAGAYAPHNRQSCTQSSGLAAVVFGSLPTTVVDRETETPYTSVHRGFSYTAAEKSEKKNNNNETITRDRDVRTFLSDGGGRRGEKSEEKKKRKNVEQITSDPIRSDNDRLYCIVLSENPRIRRARDTSRRYYRQPKNVWSESRQNQFFRLRIDVEDRFSTKNVFF